MAKKKAKKSKAAPKVDKAAVRRAAVVAEFARLRQQDANGLKIQPEQFTELEELVLKDG